MTKVEELTRKIDEAVARWKYIYENGSNDPFWPDGVNMNLVRNHIIFDLRELNSMPQQLSMFGEPVYIGDMKDKIPPLVSRYYMAKERPIFLAPQEMQKLEYANRKEG